MTVHTPGATTRGLIKAVDRASIGVARHWLRVFLVVYGAWVLLPFAAPLLMQAGATGPGNALYAIYSLFCHQLPERSLFFFGPKLMYSLQEIGRFWSTDNAVVLRQFVGNEQLGWKMAWSDRMISVYGGVWLGGLLWALLSARAGSKGRTPQLSLLVWVLIGVMPLAIDGVSHMLNDVLAGTSGLGYRDTNAWLAALTGNALPQAFYYGDQLGSFNSWARWVTGFVFSITTVFALFPVIDESMRGTARDAERQLARVVAYEEPGR
jgi:uncharacterized membrane protein